MTRELPPFLRDMLAAPPRAGEGVHIWMYRVACQLHAHLPATEIVTLLELKVAQCGRPVPRAEIEDAVKNSIPCAWRPSIAGRGTPTLAKWPAVNKQQQEAVIRDNGTLADLWELSFPRIDDNGQHTEAIIDQLFPGNPLLCCARSKSEFDTKRREDWRGQMSQLQLIVPSPMSAVTGLTKDGKESKHTLANTGPRRFLVCEFDTGSNDEQAGLLLHLAGYAPLICVVHSGSKSLHGWFLAAGWPDTKVEKFFRYAVGLGADPATWTPCQFVRMPDGRRDNGKQQTVFFLNFQHLKIHEQPPCK